MDGGGHLNPPRWTEDSWEMTHGGGGRGGGFPSFVPSSNDRRRLDNLPVLEMLRQFPLSPPPHPITCEDLTTAVNMVWRGEPMELLLYARQLISNAMVFLSYWAHVARPAFFKKHSYESYS